MRTAFLALLACLAATPVVAAPAEDGVPQGPRPDIVRGSCDAHGCDELSVLSEETVLSRPGLALKRTRLRTYRLEGGVRTARQDEVGAVACSPVRPAVVAERGGRMIAVYLAPEAGDPGARYVNVVATYFAVCHGPTLARSAVADLALTAARLGYDVPALETLAVPIQKIGDVLARPEADPRSQSAAAGPRARLPVEADAVPLPPRPIPNPWSDFDPED